eukprot:365756-Chlamydomonas_euryale.AAC.26
MTLCPSPPRIGWSNQLGESPPNHCSDHLGSPQRPPRLTAAIASAYRIDVCPDQAMSRHAAHNQPARPWCEEGRQRGAQDAAQGGDRELAS